ncbi:hypothetical protein RDWZM_009767 [Blomia tropicalis]|uniref:Uncharacterized protein n=1 Tax=Blomia tropicalis TaxID=40697 RepID=A0A9Q0M3N7_BLOTA|nr:hypothetical protein RDWZM_009767 [Blomia tropicalis]
MSTTTANDTTDTNNESKIDKSFTESASTAIKKECLTLDTQRPVVTSVAITPELIRRRQQRTRVNAEQLDPVGHFLIQEKSIKSLSSNFTSKATKQQEQQQYKQQNPDDETRGNSRSSEADNKNLFLSNTKLQQLACEKTILSAIIDLRSRLKLPIVTIITCVALGFVTLIWKKLNNH